MKERSPAAGVDRDEVLEQAQLIAASPPFARSERLRGFLEFVVRETLEGRGGQIKEYTVASDVFRRSDTYDSRSDALVRVEASRLRRKLAEYYEGAGNDAAVIIELPKGSYQPVFSRRAIPRPSGRSRWTWLAVGAVSLAGLCTVLLVSGARVYSEQTFGGDQRARELYWQGVYLRREFTPESLERSVPVLEEVVKRRPQNAMAWAALADSYMWMAFFHTGPWEETANKTERAVAEAMKRDSGQALAWRALAFIEQFKRWNWVAAERSFQRGLRADPRNAEIHQGYALALVAHKRFDEAISHARKALELDPLSHLASNDLSVILYCSRRFEESGNRAAVTEGIRPNYAPGWAMAGMSEAAQGRYAAAIAAFRRGSELSNGAPYYMARLANALAENGERGEAAQLAEMLEARAEREFVPHIDRAWPYIALGQQAKAIAHLESALEGHETDVVFLGVDPIYDRLRSDGRFRTLLQRLGLL